MTALPEPGARTDLGEVAPLPLPLRVLVKGASTVNWTSWMGGPPSDLAYPRATEAALLASGRPAVVRDTSFTAQMTRDGLRNWQHEVVPWSPDVVVLHYGHMECVHLLLPLWLQRHFQSLRTRPGPVRDRYRQVARPTWQALARMQQRVDRRVDSSGPTARTQQVSRELDLLVSRVRMVGSPLVLVMELVPPGTKYATWFPGMADRVAVMNDVLRDVVARADHPDVELFETTAVLREVADPVTELDTLTPDGAHFSPPAHRALGEALAERIGRWANTQDHLKRPTTATTRPVDRQGHR